MGYSNECILRYQNVFLGIKMYSNESKCILVFLGISILSQ